MSKAARNHRMSECLTVSIDGEEREVFNWVNVKQPAVVRGHNPTVETFEAEIGAGDSPRTPDAVTEWVANELWHEFDIDLSRRDDIDVIDIEDNEVQVV